MKSKQKDPTAFKLWSHAIRVELENLITHGTFAIVDSEKDNKIVPTTLVLKVKLTSEGNMESQEDTWSPTSSKKILQLSLSDAARNKSKEKQLLAHSYKRLSGPNFLFPHLQNI